LDVDEWNDGQRSSPERVIVIDRARGFQLFDSVCFVALLAGAGKVRRLAIVAVGEVGSVLFPQCGVRYGKGSGFCVLLCGWR
jgi:hypothetical protein